MVYWRQAILAPDTSCVVLLLLNCCLRRISRRNVGVGANYVVALDGRLATDPRQSVCPLAICGFYDRSMAEIRVSCSIINFFRRCLDLHSLLRIVKITPTAAFHLLNQGTGSYTGWPSLPDHFPRGSILPLVVEFSFSVENSHSFLNNIHEIGCSTRILIGRLHPIIFALEVISLHRCRIFFCGRKFFIAF
jgi:hypothetical protein